MPRPRWTTRRIMALVAALAVGLALGIPAVQVASDRKYHRHGSIILADQSNNPGGAFGPDGSPLMNWEGAVATPFWPRYWRRLLGRPGGIPPACGPREGHLADACSFGHPEWSSRGGMKPTPEMLATFQRLARSTQPRLNPPAPALPATASP